MLTAACIIGLGVRLLFLGNKSLWLDEALSLTFAAAPEKLMGSGFDHAHPPLYYVLLHYWLPLGESIFVLRLSSALLGSFAIPLSYLLALNLGGRKVAVTTAWLVALSPLLIWYSQELRSYSLLLALGLLATLALLHLVARPEIGWWLLFVISMDAALYTHYASALLIAAQLGIIAVLYLQKRATRSGVLFWLLSWPVVALLYWPWLTSPGMRAFTEKLLASNLYPFELLSSRLSLSPTWVGGGLLLIVPTVVLAVYLLLRHRPVRWNEWAATPLVRGGVLLLFLAITVVSVVPRLYTAKKLVVALWPYGLLAVAWIFPWSVANRRPLFLLLTTSLVASLVTVTVIPKDQWREIAGHLATHGESTDSIWIVPGYHRVPLNYYFTHPDQTDVEATSPLEFNFDNVSPAMSDAELEALLGQGRRVWLIYHAVDFRITDPERRLETWLSEHLTPIARLHLYRIEATLYTPR